MTPFAKAKVSVMIYQSIMRISLFSSLPRVSEVWTVLQKLNKIDENKIPMKLYLLLAT